MANDSLEVDVNELRKVATDLNTAAGDFTLAANLVSGCAPPSSSQPWQSTVVEWTLFQGNVADLLSDTANNLTDTATALNRNADSYESTDQNAAGTFTKIGS